MGLFSPFWTDIDSFELSDFEEIATRSTPNSICFCMNTQVTSAMIKYSGNYSHPRLNLQTHSTP